MAADDRAALGAFGEGVAARFLCDQGMEILDRNWRCARGEIDIVARSGHDLVVVEVKARRGTSAGYPIEAVTYRKLSRLRSLAVAWLQEHPQWRPAGIRFDVVGVLVGTDEPSRVRHVIGVTP